MTTSTTYKKTTSPTAIFGEQSPAVLELQKQLNGSYGGKPGYTLLKEDGKYGPLTQAAYTQFQNQTNTGTPPVESTPIVPPANTPADTTRYARTANPKDKSISDLESKIAGFNNIDAPDLTKITEEKRKNAQALVDSISAEFAKVLSDQGVENSSMNDRVRALNTSAGLSGSDFATANAVGQEKKNAKAIELIEKERNAKIQAVYAGIDERASKEYKEQRETYVKGLGDNLTALKTARDEDRTKALSSIKGFASAGVDIAKLKTSDPDTFNTLLQEYGGNQLDLETAWNDALPDEMKTKYENKVIQGQNGNAVVFRYGLNPRTGKVENNQYDMGIKYTDYAGKGEPELKEIDGRLWSVTKDEKGNQVAKPLTEVSELTRSMINENNAQAEKARKEMLLNEDPAVTKELQDAQAAIDGGADQDKVRRMFLDLYPKKGDLFLKYTKQQY